FAPRSGQELSQGMTCDASRLDDQDQSFATFGGPNRDARGLARARFRRDHGTARLIAAALEVRSDDIDRKAHARTLRAIACRLARKAGSRPHTVRGLAHGP